MKTKNLLILLVLGAVSIAVAAMVDANFAFGANAHMQDARKSPLAARKGDSANA